MRKLILLCLMIFMLVGCGKADVFEKKGNVKGTIGIMLGDGALRYGTRLQVRLVNKKFLIPYDEKWISGGKYESRLAILYSLDEFNKKVLTEISSNPSYVVAETISNLNGQFKFDEIKSGDYYILICWPASIGMNMVSWQVPIKIEHGKITEVELSNDNLAMPSFFTGAIY